MASEEVDDGFVRVAKRRRVLEDLQGVGNPVDRQPGNYHREPLGSDIHSLTKQGSVEVQELELGCRFAAQQDPAETHGGIDLEHQLRQVNGRQAAGDYGPRFVDVGRRFVWSEGVYVKLVAIHANSFKRDSVCEMLKCGLEMAGELIEELPRRTVTCRCPNSRVLTREQQLSGSVRETVRDKGAASAKRLPDVPEEHRLSCRECAPRVGVSDENLPGA